MDALKIAAAMMIFLAVADITVYSLIDNVQVALFGQINNALKEGL